MSQEILAMIEKVNAFDRLETLERNIHNGKAATPEIEAAIKAKYGEFGRQILAEKIGIDLHDLTPAEERIVDAVGRYVGLQKRDGKSASRTFQLLKNRGLIDAAEVTVAKSKVTQGFIVLEEADLRDLSFEQIIVDHPKEFSARALWYARRTLGLDNDGEKPPVESGTPTQQRTETVLDWLRDRALAHSGVLSGYTNAEVGHIIGFEDLSRHGRVLGNIQSRIDFACYRALIPPLGLCAVEPFANAWGNDGQNWAYPVPQMQAAARAFQWTSEAIEQIRRESRLLPGTASISWKNEPNDKIRRWAESLRGHPVQQPVIYDDPDARELLDIERKLLSKKPEVRERVSRTIERGAIGDRLKRVNGFACQICDALGFDHSSFIKANGERYAEAHHATPVSEQEVGSLAASNIMILCANHHRQMHYGNVKISRTPATFELEIDGVAISIKRFGLTV